MKRNVIAILLCLCVMFSLSLPALAEETTLSHVTDSANLLSQEQRDRLEQTAQAISENYRCHVYVVTLYDYREYGSTPEETTEWIYETYGLGYGSEKDGLILMLSMAERDYYLRAYGSFGNEAFNEYARLRMTDSFLVELQEDDWYEGLGVYLEKCETYLQMAAEGEPFTANRDTGNVAFRVGLVILIAGLAAGIPCGIFVSQMKTAKRQAEAQAYMQVDESKLTVCTDVFTHRTQTRRKIETKSRGSSGSRSSSGNGGKF